jgi:hypothetical protein
MQDHRIDDGQRALRRACASPPAANGVYGLGESHALRVDFSPMQLPWLAVEIDSLRSTVQAELARVRARLGQTGIAREGSSSTNELEAEVERREYQLQVLGMVRDQVPVSPPVARAGVTSPWDEPGELVLEFADLTERVTVVGPARGMLVLIHGAATSVADALAAALRPPGRDVREHPGGLFMRLPDSGRLSATVARKLVDLAAAAQAFTEIYTDAVRLQGYSFDPEHYPISSDELW